MAEDTLVGALREVLAREGADAVELEFRLGHSDAAGFGAGVTAEAWQRVLDALTRRLGPPRETQQEDQLDQGTGCRYDAAAGVATYKRKLRHLDEAGRPWTARGSVATEETRACEGRRRPPGEFAYWRRKRRYSFRMECWRYDLTVVQSNLPWHADSDVETYEVEVELEVRDVLYARPLDNVVGWGWTLARDLRNLATTVAH